MRRFSRDGKVLHPPIRPAPRQRAKMYRATVRTFHCAMHRSATLFHMRPKKDLRDGHGAYRTGSRSRSTVCRCNDRGRTTHFARRSLATIAGVTIVDAVLPQLVRM